MVMEIDTRKREDDQVLVMGCYLNPNVIHIKKVLF